MSSALVDNLQAKSSALSARLLDAVELSEAYNAKIAAIDPADKDANSKIEALIVQRNEGYATAKAAVAAADKEYKDAIIEINNNGTSQDISECNVIVSAQTTFGTDVIKPRADAAKAAFIDSVSAKRAEIGTTSPESKPEPKVESPTQPASAASVKAELPPADSVAGVGTSGFGNKVEEGLLSASDRYGAQTPFTKPTATSPTFFQLSNPLAIAQSQGKTFASPVLDNLIANQVKQTPPQASATSTNAAAPKSSGEDKSHLVTLEDNEGNLIEFLVMPEITENRSAEYEAVAPPQFPGAFQKYKGTSSVQWLINATFISRTTPEATKNLINLNILRGWTMPYFGDKIKNSFNFSQKLGAPPPVLIFKGFRSAIVGPVPVVITSLTWSWPRDVDYIPATAPDGSAFNVPFPTVMTLTINVVESFSTEQFNNFDLEAYRVGNFEAAFGGGSAVAKNATSDQQKDFGDTKSAKTGEAISLPGMEEIGAYKDLAKEEAQKTSTLGGGFSEMLQDSSPPAISERPTVGSPYVSTTVTSAGEAVQLPGMDQILPPVPPLPTTAVPLAGFNEILPTAPPVPMPPEVPPIPGFNNLVPNP